MLEQLPDEQKWYDRFRHTNGIIYLFAKLSVDGLKVPIPENAHSLGQITDKDGEVVRQKTVLEFISGGENETGGLVTYLENDQVIFLASAMDAPTYRMKRFTEADAEQWKVYADAVWGDEYTFLTIAERNEYLPQEG